MWIILCAWYSKSEMDPNAWVSRYKCMKFARSADQLFSVNFPSIQSLFASIDGRLIVLRQFIAELYCRLRLVFDLLDWKCENGAAITIVRRRLNLMTTDRKAACLREKDAPFTSMTGGREVGGDWRLGLVEDTGQIGCYVMLMTYWTRRLHRRCLHWGHRAESNQPRDCTTIYRTTVFSFQKRTTRHEQLATWSNRTYSHWLT